MGNLYFIKKGGYYYRHDDKGYTESIFEAEIYDDKTAAHYVNISQGELKAIKVVDAIKPIHFSACLRRINKMKKQFEPMFPQMGESDE